MSGVPIASRGTRNEQVTSQKDQVSDDANDEATAGRDYRYHVFISYRRQQNLAASLLESELRRNGMTCFRDNESLSPGGPWRDEIEAALRSSYMALVIINPNFATLNNPDTGQMRLAEPGDVFAREIQIALDLYKRGSLLLIPVLAEALTPEGPQDARMPDRFDLPASIRGLLDINGVPVRNLEDPHSIQLFVQDVHKRLSQRGVNIPESAA
jgi:TIR domain